MTPGMETIVNLILGKLGECDAERWSAAAPQLKRNAACQGSLNPQKRARLLAGEPLQDPLQTPAPQGPTAEKQGERKLDEADSDQNETRQREPNTFSDRSCEAPGLEQLIALLQFQETRLKVQENKLKNQEIDLVAIKINNDKLKILETRSEIQETRSEIQETKNEIQETKNEIQKAENSIRDQKCKAQEEQMQAVVKELANQRLFTGSGERLFICQLLENVTLKLSYALQTAIADEVSELDNKDRRKFFMALPEYSTLLTISYPALLAYYIGIKYEHQSKYFESLDREQAMERQQAETQLERQRQELDMELYQAGEEEAGGDVEVSAEEAEYFRRYPEPYAGASGDETGQWEEHREELWREEWWLRDVQQQREEQRRREEQWREEEERREQQWREEEERREEQRRLKEELDEEMSDEEIKKRYRNESDRTKAYRKVEDCKRNRAARLLLDSENYVALCMGVPLLGLRITAALHALELKSERNSQAHSVELHQPVYMRARALEKAKAKAKVKGHSRRASEPASDEAVEFVLENPLPPTGNTLTVHTTVKNLVRLERVLERKQEILGDGLFKRLDEGVFVAVVEEVRRKMSEVAGESMWKELHPKMEEMMVEGEVHLQCLVSLPELHASVAPQQRGVIAMKKRPEFRVFLASKVIEEDEQLVRWETEHGAEVRVPFIGWPLKLSTQAF